MRIMNEDRRRSSSRYLSGGGIRYGGRTWIPADLEPIVDPTRLAAVATRDDLEARYPRPHAQATDGTGAIQSAAYLPPIHPERAATTASWFASVQKLGREETRGGGGGSGNRAQAHGSRPVQVRPGETPGSPVARLPASGETPVVEAEQRSPWKGASNRPVRSIKRSLQRRHLHLAEPRAKGEPSPCKQGEGHGRHLGAWSGCPRTLRRMGRGTVGRLPWELERASSAPGPAGSSGSDASPITG